MKSERCLKCKSKLTVPGTPATVWCGRSIRGLLCAGCLRACAGSLLYRVDWKRLKAMKGSQRLTWLASLDERDRAAL